MFDASTPLGPNVKRLIILVISRIAIPPGGGLGFFADKGNRKRILDSAERWTRDSINAIRNAGEPNPWRTASDDEIAAEILRRSGERGKEKP